MELDTFIPIERARPSPSKKASNGLTAEKNPDQGGTRKNAKQAHGHKQPKLEAQKDTLSTTQQQQRMQMQQAYLNSLDMQHQMTMLQGMPQMALMSAPH